MNKKNTILIVDDEPQIRKLLTIALESSGYKVVTCDNGSEATMLAGSVKPDLVILDLGLPDIDGKEALEAIRSYTQVPVIICSVRDEDEEIVAALDQGANDYITKPFSPQILLARIRANLRQAATEEAGSPELTNGPIKMDLVRHEVFLNEEKIALTPKEYDLLRYFMTQQGRMLTHRQILKDIWGPANVDDMQYLRVYIGQLREKIETDPSDPHFIITEPGIGYRMETLSSGETDSELRAASL